MTTKTDTRKPLSTQVSQDGQYITDVYEIPEKDRTDGGLTHNTVTRPASFEEQIDALKDEVADQVRRMIPLAYAVDVEAKGRTLTLTLLDEGERDERLDKTTAAHERAAKREHNEGPARGQTGESPRPKPGASAVKEKVEADTDAEKTTKSGGKVAQ
jgi:hypothetical protein